MKIELFELERWQSVWENRVELNIAESGVEPLSVRELIEDAADLGRVLDARLGYPQTNGSEELRGRIAALYPAAKAENVLLTCGGAEANYVVTWGLVERGDEVIFMQPNYMQVAGLARGFGANVKPWRLREELQWAPDLDELKRLVSPKTKLIAVCNPSNPTGAVLNEHAMDEICATAGKAGAWILADEVYRGAEFNGQTTPSFYGRYERVLCTAGLSKAYGLPGLRTGWLAGPAEMAEKLWGYHDYTSIGPSMLTDRIASLALQSQRHAKLLERTRRILRENYPVMSEWLRKHEDLFTHVPPRAGAIAWIGLRMKWNSAQVAEELRAQKSVLLVPGEQFAMPAYLRVGFGEDAGKLRKALGRVDEWIAQRGVRAKGDAA
ncbi:MAG TPA: aminotransferase class I/II-fold pyridoxal phosphate-dependent enzyme [Candidatus Acidoferrales bacterium]|nr:aminotransferase class I/II-fold pyridoxal phosphate-dependent enzyme [Candidatus Acidoferrales bacterium]